MHGTHRYWALGHIGAEAATSQILSTPEHINSKKEEVKIREEALILDQDFVVGYCGLARYCETKRRHFTATMQEPSLCAQPMVGTEKCG